ncbi:hypothetical protein Tco_0844684 [Tanacetum coccineum]
MDFRKIIDLKKPQGSEDFHQIVDFLNGSYIRYALIENPTIYVSPINQFWRTASTRTLDNEEIEINTTVDGQDKTITKASVRRHLKLADSDGISTLPTTEIFEQLALMGFLQLILNKDSRLNTSLKRLYIAPALIHKVFSNMKRESMGFSGVETALFPTMLVNEQLSLGKGPTSLVGTQHTPTVIETSPQLQNLSITYRKTRNRTRRMGIRIPQSNVLSSVADEAITKEMHDGLGRATTTISSLEVEQGSCNIFKTQTKATPSRPSSPRTSSEGGPWCHVTMGCSFVQARPERLSNLPNEPTLGEGKVTAMENELSSTKAVHNKALITLTKRVKKSEKKLKLKRRSAVGRMIEEVDEDENVNLVKNSKQWEAHDTARHRIESDDIEVVNFSTASPQNDDDEVTLAETLVNIKMSAIKDKGKAIIDPVVLRYHAVQNRSFSIAKVRKNMCIYLKNRGGYKQSHFKGMSYEDIRPIFERVWDQNHAFIPNDSKIENEVMKRSGFDLQQESLKQVEDEIVQHDDVVSEQVVKESSRKAKGRLKRNTSKARKDKDKRQKNQDDPEKHTLIEYVEVISNFEEVISVIPLAVKSSIVSWKSYCKEDVGYYEIHRADGSYKTYMFFSEMLNDFDREDLIVLYRLFNEKYASTRPGFDDLMLWGDMKIMFEPNDDDAVWKNHHSQELIEWKLYDSCGVHSLMLGEVSIHMLVEKKYPLPQDTLMRMLQWKLHVNYNVTEMAYELLRFIRSQLNQ